MASAIIQQSPSKNGILDTRSDEFFYLCTYMNIRVIMVMVINV